MTLDYAGGACACDRDRSGLDPGFSGAFRYLEKDCTFAKVHGARSVAEPDNRFRAKTRDRLVRERQFAASSRAGANNITVANAFADRGKAWHRLRGSKLHVFHRLCNARFFHLRGIQTGCSQEKTNEQTAAPAFCSGRRRRGTIVHAALEF
jgi:hypothetical protein